MFSPCAEEQEVSIKEEIILVGTVADGVHGGLVITATTTTGCVFGSYAHGKKVCAHAPTQLKVSDDASGQVCREGCQQGSSQHAE